MAAATTTTTTTTAAAIVESDIRSAFRVANNLLTLRRAPTLTFSLRRSTPSRFSLLSRLRAAAAFSSSSSSSSSSATEPVVKLPEKPPVCTADELHYVSVPNSDWRLALWRYHPSPHAPPRNHPLLLLSGVGTNAIGYDLSPGSSFARYMSGQGYETWILEVRGAGLSVQGSDSQDVQRSALEVSQHMEAVADSVSNGQHSARKLSQQIEAAANPNGVTNGATNGALSAGAPRVDVLSSVSDYELSTVQELATVWDESQLVIELTETFMRLSERLSGFLSEGQSKIMSAKLFDQISKLLEDTQLSERFDEIRGKFLGLLETNQNSAIAGQINDLSQKLVGIFEEGQRSVSPQFFDMQERLASTIEDFQKQLDLIVKYDWDFDNYLEEDVPAVMEYIRAESKPKDGKLLAIGHSMGGILLYARLSRCGCEGRDSGLAAIATLASSLDYTSSKSRLKLLLPLADPAQALNVPVLPLGTLLAAAYPLSSRPPYVLSWLNYMISAEDMMHPELLEKLVLNNFCTIPAKVILQLTTAFREGGLRDRNGKFFYKDHIHKSNVPILALAGDQDLICPPEAVEATVKLMPERLVTYEVFGKPGGPHYAHYDLVGGRLAVEQVYPCVVQFLDRYDKV